MRKAGQGLLSLGMQQGLYVNKSLTWWELEVKHLHQGFLRWEKETHFYPLWIQNGSVAVFDKMANVS